MIRVFGVVCFAVFLAALTPLASHAATPIRTNVQINKGDRSVQVVWTTNELGSSTRSRCDYDYDTVSLDRSGPNYPASSSSSATRNCTLVDLSPGTKIYISPQSRDSGSNWTTAHVCASTCTNCGSTDDSFFADNSGLDCDAIGEFPNFTSDPLDVCAGGPPCLPAPPSHAPSLAGGPPAVTGTTRTVAAGCTDLLSLLNDAASAASSGGTVEEVVIPPGEVCRPENESGSSLNRYIVPDVTSPGLVILRSGADPKLLPPPGTRVDPSYFPHMGKIQYNQDDLSGLSGLEVFRGASGRRGYYLMGILFGFPEVADLPSLSFSVTGVNTTSNTITVTSTSGLSNGDHVVSDLSGSGVFGGQGPFQACSVTGTTLQLRTGGCTGAVRDLTGTHTGGGMIHRFIARPITAVSDTTPVQLTVPDHGFANYLDATISGASGGQLTISGTVSDYQIGSNSAVWVQGNGACDGRWVVSSTGSNTITLSGAPSCGTSGTVRRLRGMAVFGTDDADLDRPWHFDAVDAHTLTLLGSTAQGSTFAAGSVAYDPDVTAFMVNVGDIQGSGGGMSDVTFDRCAFEAPPPWRADGHINMTATTRVVLKNSWLRGEKWRAIDPVTEGTQSILGSGSGMVSLLFQGGSDLQIVNNTFLPHPYVFADTGRQVEDLSLSANTIFNPDNTVDGTELSNGFYYRHGFCIELKSCQRCELKGNYLKGCRSDFNQVGPAIELSAVGRNSATQDNQIADVRVESNTVERSATFLQTATNQGNNTSQRLLPSMRYLIQNNLVVNMEGRRYFSAVTGRQSANSGQFLQSFDGIEDAIVTRNTFHVKRSLKPMPLHVGFYRSNGHKNEDNIYVVTEGFADNDKGVRQDTSGNFVPGPSQSDGSPAFDEIFVRGTGPDPLSSFANNVIIPGIEQSSSGSFATKASSTDTTDTLCVHELVGHSTLTTFSGLTFVGSTANPCLDSFEQRLNLAFESGTWAPKAAYSGKGADIDMLKDDQGQYGVVTVNASSNQATISWTAPDTDPCTVDLTHMTLDFSVASNITRETYSGAASKSQNVTFGGLSPATQYAYRISCKRPALRGLLTTGG